MITNYRLELLILYQILLVDTIVMCREKCGEYATSAPSPSIYISSILECTIFSSIGLAVMYIARRGILLQYVPLKIV